MTQGLFTVRTAVRERHIAFEGLSDSTGGTTALETPQKGAKNRTLFFGNRICHRGV
jgi:hypothetical protein